MSAEPAVEGSRPTAPATPRPAGVVDLARYRGRTVAAPAVVPPPRRAVESDGAVVAEPERSPLARGVTAPALVPDTEAPPTTRTEPGRGVVAGEVVVRRVRLGSVFRMALGLSLCTFVVVIGAGVLIWVTISTLGVVANLESLVEDLGWTDVHFDGPAMLRAACIGGGILVVAASLLAVIFAEIFNLLSTITGGLRAEVAPAPMTRRQRRQARRAARRTAKRAAKRAAKAADR